MKWSLVVEMISYLENNCTAWLPGFLVCTRSNNVSVRTSVPSNLSAVSTLSLETKLMYPKPRPIPVLESRTNLKGKGGIDKKPWRCCRSDISCVRRMWGRVSGREYWREKIYYKNNVETKEVSQSSPLSSSKTS